LEFLNPTLFFEENDDFEFLGSIPDTLVGFAMFEALSFPTSCFRDK